MLQTWLRTGVKKTGYWDTGATNFKQCCGLTADLVVDFIIEPGVLQNLCFITELIPLVQIMLNCFFFNNFLGLL